MRVHLRGGLGNQLFQYAAGLALAESHDAKLVLDTSLLPLKAQIGHVSQWPEQVSSFNHGAAIEHGNNVPLIRWAVSRYLQLERLIGDHFPGLLAFFGIFANETRPSFKHFTNLRSNHFRLNSYCNGFRYANPIAELVRHNVLALIGPSAALSDSLKDSADQRPIGIHVRLGDYKNLENIYGKFDADYFVEGALLARKHLGNRPVWLFSDDPVSALSELEHRIPDIILAPRAALMTGIETLVCMASLDGLVCSSSSFSWWAANLGGGKMLAIFPRPLFAEFGPNEPKDSLLEHWIQIGRKL